MSEPEKLYHDINVRNLARQHTEDAVNVLQSIMNDPLAPHAARIQAANSVLDRAWGKPTAYVEATNKTLNLNDLLRDIHSKEQKFQAVMSEDHLAIEAMIAQEDEELEDEPEEEEGHVIQLQPELSWEALL
jgi:hypothetical protein